MLARKNCRDSSYVASSSLCGGALVWNGGDDNSNFSFPPAFFLHCPVGPNDDVSPPGHGQGEGGCSQSLLARGEPVQLSQGDADRFVSEKGDCAARRGPAEGGNSHPSPCACFLSLLRSIFDGSASAFRLPMVVVSV